MSYFCSRSLFLVLELGVLISFGRLVYGAQIQGSVAALLVAATLGAAAFAAIGFLIGARLSSTAAWNDAAMMRCSPSWSMGRPPASKRSRRAVA